MVIWVSLPVEGMFRTCSEGFYDTTEILIPFLTFSPFPGLQPGRSCTFQVLSAKQAQASPGNEYLGKGEWK